MFDALTDVLKNGIRRSRTLTELVESVQFEFEHPPDGPVILVHQMGGVGSAAVLQTLLRRFPRANVYRTHYLNPETIRWHRERFAELHRRTGRAVLDREFLAARALTNRRRGRVRLPWKVITIVRDPVARTMSAFFRRFRLNHPDRVEGFEADPANVDRLIDLFLADDEPERGITLEWFDREVRDVLGIDVYDRPFPYVDGSATFSGANCSLLIVRTEDLGQTGRRAIASFVDTPDLRIDRENTSSGEPYADAYARFLERIRIPDAYLDVMYGSRLARHFYTEAETAAFRSHWRRD